MIEIFAVLGAVILLAFLVTYSRRLHNLFRTKLLLRDGKRSFVYFMSDDHGDIVKIGRAINVKNRLKQFQTANHDIKLLAYYPETDVFNETILHRHFDSRRIKNKHEWFENSNELQKVISQGKI